MKMTLHKMNGISFYAREGTSDLKTFEEVINKDAYRKKGMSIEAGEDWVDCGANVGAFTLLACSLGANVVAYEPDPNNCLMIEKNLALNGFKAKIVCAALVHNDIKKANLYVGNNGNVWRNSLVKNWNGKGLKVDCLNFDEVVSDGVCVKMDIEGAEMLILENTNRKFQKLVFEWSFDIDGSLTRYWAILEKLSQAYTVQASRYENTGYDFWQKSWFPACTNVFCYAKN